MKSNLIVMLLAVTLYEPRALASDVQTLADLQACYNTKPYALEKKSGPKPMAWR